MNFVAEFRKFIARGNVLDLAIGVVIGAAFGKIVTSLTESIIMPLIGWVFGDVDFSNYFWRLGSVPEGYDGALTNYAELKEAGVAMIGYGEFLTQLVNFLIIAFALFMLLRTVNRVIDEVQELASETEESATTDAVTTDPQLDVLKKILAELRSDGGNKGGAAGGSAGGPAPAAS
ncbi:large conductance mechanosensitive channel protein MscL [Erythrobacter sp.]|jgi:large conductance mechanosensitive channel|uniref:large conductance mechanosensitive channel protein MscL n=1 Tax=Erythrobacter sp. TaxID=1042 RepID=UPI002EB1DFE3|nr:large conductance mechanosensitive channel protein MscL [Erythrobacter sp.]